MDWDMVIVTGALLGVIMLVAILGLIWRDKAPNTLESVSKGSHEFAAPSGELDKVAGQENSLA